MRSKLIFLIIILIAILTRILFLADFPRGFSGDEAQQGYSAYSILKTSRDEWGQFLPLFPRGFGDFKPPLYTYLTIPSVAIFGLTEEAVRLPAAIMGILMVWVIYLLTKELFDQKIALWSSFLLSINPWHIQISRTAFEGGAGVLFFSLGILFFLKSKLNKNYLILMAFFWGVTLYSYHSFRVFTILMIIGIFLIREQRILVLKSKNYLTVIVFTILILPLIFNIKTSLVRASDVGITSAQYLKGYFENKGTSFLSEPIDRFFDNKFLYISRQFYENYFSYYSLQFFFTGQRSDSSYLNFPVFGLLYPVEILLWIMAAWVLVKNNNPYKKIIILWFLLASVPAALGSGAMSANRAVTFLPVVSILSALGANFLKRKYAKIMLVSLSVSFIFFLRFYFFSLPLKQIESLRGEYKPIFKKVLEVQSDYDEIIISKSLNEPQIFLSFYGKINPNDFQKASQDWLRYEKSDKLYVDQLESWNLGKFYFEDINWINKDSKRPNALIVARIIDFPPSVPSITDFKNQQGEVTYKLVPTKYAR